MPMPDDFNPNVREPLPNRCPECGWDGGSEDEERLREASQLLLAIDRHPGITIKCEGDDAAETWNRLAQLLSL